MRVFVTGGAGFIGSHVCEKFLQAGHQVTAFDNLSLGRRDLLKSCFANADFEFIEADILDLKRLTTEMQNHDLVYHLAANSDISQGAKQTDIDLKNGTLATYNVLEAMRLTKVQRLIFASTSAIYGEASVKPTPENYGPLYPISFYGASKLACEALCTAFSHNYDLQIWAYRFANIVGSHSTHGVIYDFIERLKKEPKRLTILGNGTQRKSYLHVSDCVKGMQFGFEHSAQAFQLFNLASVGVTNVRFIAEEVTRQMKAVTAVQAELVFGEGDRGWKGDVAYTYLDGKAFHELGWEAQLDSDGAVRLAISEIIKERCQ